MERQVKQALREYDALRDPEGDPTLEAVKAAIVLEDLLGVTIGDDDIELLRDPDGLRVVLARLVAGL